MLFASQARGPTCCGQLVRNCPRRWVAGLKSLVLTYTGTRKVTCSERRMRLFVNGKPGYTWYVSITVSAADLYDIELWSVRGDRHELLGEAGDLYFDDLQAAVEALYDKAIKEHNHGAIYLS
jgi:hypothetical protein